MRTRNIIKIFDIYKQKEFNVLYEPVIIDHSEGIETTKIMDHLELTIKGADENTWSQYELSDVETYPIGFYKHLVDVKDCLWKPPYAHEDLLALDDIYNWEYGVGGTKSTKE